MPDGKPNNPNPPPPPPPDVDGFGNYWTGRFRLRPTLFGTVLEELQNRHDGTLVWMRRKWPVEVVTRKA